MKSKYDVVIVGGGPGGTVSALALLQVGIRPLILEKQPFPRFHIGESLSSEAGESLRRLGLSTQMQAAGYLRKHGVKVFGAQGKNAFWVPIQIRDATHQLQPSTSWHVRRSHFDQLLLETALERGAGYVAGEALTPIVKDGRVRGVRLRTPAGTTESVAAEVVIDASGQATWLANRSDLTSGKERGAYNRQVAIFSHVQGAQYEPDKAATKTLIFYRQKHHWAWFIPLDDEVVSLGVVVPSRYFQASQLTPQAFLERELQTLNPELTWRVQEITYMDHVRTASNYSYHIRHFTGQGFLCVGDAHRFIDPIFSFGLNFAISEGCFAAKAIADILGGTREPKSNPFAEYQDLAERGQNIVQDLVDCFWNFPMAFLLFVRYRYQEDMIDMFAGRVYDDGIEASVGRQALRRMLATPHSDKG